MANSISGLAGLAGTQVNLTGAATATTTAGPTGAYSFAGLAAGSYTITPVNLRWVFTPASQTVVVVATDITGVNFLAVPKGSATTTFTLQNEYDKLILDPDLESLFDVGGYTDQPLCTAATDTMKAMCEVNFPWKWNEINLPYFYTFSWQQDYALINPDGTSLYTVEWLERGIAIDINNNSIPKPWVDVECGRSLPMRTGTYTGNTGTMLGNPAFVVSSLPNASLYYGVWGQPNVASPTLGNNPVAGSVYTNPVGNYSQPANPISQIVDANGNLLLLTTYGTEGTTAPLAAIGALPGTQVSGSGASTIWTVVDPQGMGIRILEVPSQTGVVWQFNLVGQKPPVQFTSVAQSLSPLPDKYEPYFREGLRAQLYKYSPKKSVKDKHDNAWRMWLKGLNDFRQNNDRELEEYSFVPERTIMGGGMSRNRYQGGAWPYNYPRP